MSNQERPVTHVFEPWHGFHSVITWYSGEPTTEELDSIAKLGGLVIYQGCESEAPNWIVKYWDWHQSKTSQTKKSAWLEPFEAVVREAGWEKDIIKIFRHPKCDVGIYQGLAFSGQRLRDLSALLARHG